MAVQASIKRVSGKSVHDVAARLKPKAVKVGVLSGTGEHPNADAGQTIAEIAWWNEFGTPSAKRPIPARPFLRSTMAENKKEYFKIQAQLMRLILTGKIPSRQASAILGMKVQADIQNKIVALRVPPNKDMTKDLKGGKSNPLIDSGHLKNHIMWIEV
jgi:hypothetical protein